ncbi:MAG: DNA repair protein RadA [Burkholderiales bacterium]|nr:DNA repair protein RadA [Phycisphaerae bacterium]
MARVRTQFLCNNCGSVQHKWFGKCPDCGTWDALSAYTPPTEDKHRATQDRAIGDITRGAEALTLDEIDTDAIDRIPTGIGEFDRILGGGIVPGSATLVGGEPGIGKSTLLLQVAGLLARSVDDKVTRSQGDKANTIVTPSPHHPVTMSSVKVMYVTSEESARQTKLRAERISLNSPNLRILAETNIERITHQIEKHKPDVVIVDSIQMIYKPQLPAAPGSVTQLRDCCMQLVYLAKSTGTAVLVVGHVTKAGTLAGPKIIEHIVDTVVYFEGDRFHSHRIVRCVKNRFGSTHEVGVFEMTGDGLKEVADPAALFVHAHGQPTSGTILTAAMQGSRVMVLEVQALTASSVIGAAKRKTSGVSNDRVAMILAVLEKRCDLRLAADDVFVNIAGGVKVIEPAVDLAIALAIASAHINRPIAPGTLALGELGLGGEIRPVPQLDARLREASRLGASQSIVPPVGNTIPRLNGMALHEVRRVSQALAAL